ncbi:MAG TPA: hypothetical protein VFZ97_10625 [Acidimicrobiales bacterium]
MSSQYITGVISVILGGFVVVATRAFHPVPVGWIAFGVAIAIIAVAVLAQLDRSRGAIQRALDAATVAVAGLMMAFGFAASGRAVIWLSFAFSLGVVGLAFAGLTLHEISNWRFAHQLGALRWLPQERSVSDATRRPDSLAA